MKRRWFGATNNSPNSIGGSNPSSASNSPSMMRSSGGMAPVNGAAVMQIMTEEPVKGKDDILAEVNTHFYPGEMIIKVVDGIRLLQKSGTSGGDLANGMIILTTYRLIHASVPGLEKRGRRHVAGALVLRDLIAVSIPYLKMGSVEKKTVGSNRQIKIYCKDVRVIKIFFEDMLEGKQVYKILTQRRLIGPNRAPFAFSFSSYFIPHSNGWNCYDPIQEYTRMGLSETIYNPVDEPASNNNVNTTNATDSPRAQKEEIVWRKAFDTPNIIFPNIPNTEDENITGKIGRSLTNDTREWSANSIGAVASNQSEDEYLKSGARAEQDENLCLPDNEGNHRLRSITDRPGMTMRGLSTAQVRDRRIIIDRRIRRSKSLERVELSDSKPISNWISASRPVQRIGQTQNIITTNRECPSPKFSQVPLANQNNSNNSWIRADKTNENEESKSSISSNPGNMETNGPPPSTSNTNTNTNTNTTPTTTTTTTSLSNSGGIASNAGLTSSNEMDNNNKTAKLKPPSSFPPPPPLPPFRRGGWVLSDINANYEYCDSYPKIFPVPSFVSRKDLLDSFSFRSKGRIPVLAWKRKETPATILRSAQPMVGVKGEKSTGDEQLLRESIALNDRFDRLVVIDARSQVAAQANRAKGAGVEGSRYNDICDVHFMGVENIHVMRESMTKLFHLMKKQSSDSSWHALLDSTGWLKHIRSVLVAASDVVENIVAGKSVLVHCSDGWDRTPQVVSISMLLLDPFFRTRRGFAVLIEKEWLAFGHKFWDRNGIDYRADKNEGSPVFLQFLDCVHQILLQFPYSFEFTDTFLIAIADESDVDRFGTFLYNSDKERKQENLAKNTCSIWSDLLDDNNYIFINPVYNPNSEVLYISCSLRCLAFWEELFLRWDREFIRPHRDLILRSAINYAQQSILSKKSLDLKSSGSQIGAELSLKGNNKLKKRFSLMLNRTPTCLRDVKVFSSDFSGLEDDDFDSASTTSMAESGEEQTLGSLVDGGTPQTPQSAHPSQTTQNAHGHPNGENSSPSSTTSTTSSKSLQSKNSSLPSRNVISSNPGDGKGPLSKPSLSFHSSPNENPSSSVWIPDHWASRCYNCQKKFSQLRRKHHCRLCGHLFCSKCTKSKVLLQSNGKPQKVCDRCHNSILPDMVYIDNTGKNASANTTTAITANNKNDNSNSNDNLALPETLSKSRSSSM